MKKIVKMSLMVMAFVFVLFNGGLTANAAKNSVKLGDSIEKAGQLKVGQKYTIKYNDGEGGWVCFQAQKEGYYVFTTKSSGYDLQGTFYDADSNLLKYQDSEYERVLTKLEFWWDEMRPVAYRFGAGEKIYIDIEPTNRYANGSISIQISYEKDAAGYDFGSARKIAIGKKAKDLISTGENTCDWDYFVFTTKQKGMYRVYAELKDKKREDCLSIFLYDENEQEVDYAMWEGHKGVYVNNSFCWQIDEMDGGSSKGYVTYKLDANKKYYVAVGGGSGDGYSKFSYSIMVKKSKL